MPVGRRPQSAASRSEGELATKPTIVASASAATPRSPTNALTTSVSTTWSADCRRLASSAGSAKRARFAAGRPRRKSISLYYRKILYAIEEERAAAKTPRSAGIDRVRESGPVETGLRKSRRLPSVPPAPRGLLPRNAGSRSNLELAHLQVHSESPMAPPLHQHGHCTLSPRACDTMRVAR